jgi:uncharacterized membrane protein
MTTKDRASNDWFRTLVLGVLGLGGLGINLMLLVRRLADSSATLPGCGAGSGCESVLGSRWSEVLGMPVTVPGFLIYAVLLLALTRAGRHLLAPVLGVICAAACWFIAVQAFVIKAFCPWCMTAHGIGLVLTLLGLPHAARAAGPWKRTLSHFALAWVIGGAGLILVQVFGPKPETHRVTEIEPPPAKNVAMMDDAHSRGEGRLELFFDGRKGYRVEELPHIGKADAPHVIVEYFDYACGACRTMAGYLSALVAAYPDDVCVVLLPVPLEHACNPALKPLDAGHPGACEMARASLAVWRETPDQFAAFHQAMLAEPTRENANLLAGALLPDASANLASPWVSSILAANIEDWQVISGGNPRLPKLVLAKRKILHGFPPTEAEFIRVIAGELGIKENP